ncbi:SRPBCC family protein [Sinorhizobium numidicum]|uniref:SRPBCC family protein n=1 Tax=Sinorhizobium numidicum TaxID=680248 RepID=A0ABY8CYA9_9HYPH|nr:SRPBCC family protein [Sinorhizobium numidicum]WEX76198.1 SRPBCC family protein [Sinorhizobium numidicum]WEX82857.1 SRPBCC family protein [Sinorhizobium numidicum]
MTTSQRIEHTSFVVERELSASPRHAFRFWSEAELKARWSGCHPDWLVLEDRFDFSVGGTEVKRWRTPAGDEQTFHAHYLDIVPEQRIIYAYEMSFAGARLSASLVTITFKTVGRKTKMTFTEQVAILAGGRAARDQRLVGTEEGLDRLVEAVESERAIVN